VKLSDLHAQLTALIAQGKGGYDVYLCLDTEGTTIGDADSDVPIEHYNWALADIDTADHPEDAYVTLTGKVWEDR
jgi:hypothetical protein